MTSDQLRQICDGLELRNSPSSNLQPPFPPQQFIQSTPISVQLQQFPSVYPQSSNFIHPQPFSYQHPPQSFSTPHSRPNYPQLQHQQHNSVPFQDSYNQAHHSYRHGHPQSFQPHELSQPNPQSHLMNLQPFDPLFQQSRQHFPHSESSQPFNSTTISSHFNPPSLLSSSNDFSETYPVNLQTHFPPTLADHLPSSLSALPLIEFTSDQLTRYCSAHPFLLSTK